MTQHSLHHQPSILKHRLRGVLCHAPRVLLLGALCVASVGVVVAVPSSAGAAAPNDYLCYVAGASQTAASGSSYAVPLEVEVSTTQCSSPTADSASGLNVAFVVTSAGNGPSVSFLPSSPVAVSGGFASTTPIANQVAGLVSVTATSSAAQGQSVTFSLQNGSGAPASITTGTGNYQSTPIDTVFALSLSVSVDDSSNDAVPYASVTFVAPTNGASGTFASNDATSVTVSANAAGIAVAPALVANAVAGGYVVQAYVDGTSLLSSFALVNEVTNALTVMSVSPPLVNQGAGEVKLSVTGSGFEAGASAGFSSSAIKISSITVVSASTIDLTVNLAASLATGSYNLTVTNPGDVAFTSPDALIVAPEVSLPAPAAFAVAFAGRSATLSAGAKSELTSYADKLLSGATIKVVGFAKSDAGLARSRARAVQRYLSSIAVGLHARVSDVTSSVSNRAEVTTITNT